MPSCPIAVENEMEQLTILMKFSFLLFLIQSKTTRVQI